MSRFIHLHTHSHYSFLQALPKIDELVDKAKREGMDALALTDAGNMHGAIEFFKAGTKAGVKPILGVDAYLAPRSRFERDPNIDAKRSRIVLLAENNEGYKNLLALVTKSWTEGFFERPRLDKELLGERRRGVIAIIPSFAGDVAQFLRARDPKGAAAALAEFREIFGPENVYLEITHHPKVAGHADLQNQIISLAHSSGTPLVAQHDVYYLEPGDREATEIMRRIQQGGRGRNEDEDFSFISEKRALEFFKDIPEAVDNSRTIADRCNLSFDLGKWTFPAVPVSPGYSDHDEELRAKAYASITERGLEKTKEVTDRVDYELDIIIKKGFAVYYLIVADLLAFARRAGILTTTRGSAAGSLVAYLTGITNVNPLFYKLPFERFLNPERPKAPDIDMDMADNRRDEMIAYAKQKYGEDHVAQIGTFGTMMARAAVRDVARALGHAYSTGDRIAKLIPIGSQGFPMTIDRALSLEPDLKLLYDEDDDAREILDLAKRIEGCVRHVGVHAAGVVVAPTPLIEWTPIQPDPKGTGKLITQYDMYSITDEYGGVGLLKFDFLGIKNLAILADAVARVKESRNVIVDIENIPIDDSRTFEMLARGETEGTFQLNGSGMTRWLKELKPTTIHDINAMVALYRPGPMETIPQYVERKRNPRLIRYVDPRMKDYLDFSYGLLVYQDDVLLTAIKLAGYSWLEADSLRKAMGKKIPAVMQAEKDKLLKGFIEYGKLSSGDAHTLWEFIEPFAAYGFNKCLPADTRIFDAETGIPTPIAVLLEQRTGPRVHTLGHDLKLTRVRSSKPFANGVKPLFKVTTRSGREIRATGNHPFRVFDGWMPLETLAPGTRIATPRSIPTPVKERPLARHEAIALGYLLSEGNLCHPHGVYFYSTREDELRDFIDAALAFSNVHITIDRSKSAASVYVGQAVRGNGNGLDSWITTLGLKGKKATEKFVPARAFSADTASLSIFLGKLWQVDGAISVKNSQAFYATSSRVLAEDVQHLLLRFGITSTIHAKLFRYRDSRKAGWTVAVTGNGNIARFAETAGAHLIGKKYVELQKLVAVTAQRTNNLGRGTPDTIPMEILKTVRSEMQRRRIHAAELAEKAGVAERLLGADARKRGMTRDSLYKIASALRSKSLMEHAVSDIFWDEIVSIVPDGREMTYDLSVPGPKNFIANNIIVHNSHAASYGKVAYQTAYMKANYPVEYLAALLTADAGDTEQIAIFVAEAKRMGIPVLPPDVNESGSVFTVIKRREDAPTEGAPQTDEARTEHPPAGGSSKKTAYPKGGASSDAIRFGLSSIKNFGEGISESIIAERSAGGPYMSLTDFLCRIDSKNLNRKSLESLIKCGALDSLSPDSARGTLLENIETLLTFHRDATARAPQDSLFGTSLGAAPSLSLRPGTLISLIDKLAWEKELLGIYVSGHPLDAHREMSAKTKLTVAKIKEEKQSGRTIVLPVLLTEVRSMLTKSGEKMAFIKVEDKSDWIEGVIFPKLFKEHGSAISTGSCLLVKAKISVRNGEPSLALENLKPL
ncbi:DNA polymerase III subunit alpha [Candidatus Kaiserbacteria bacterium]|nr:DNA polymerase III subunit alpha [Candidatus Kaiserbacteria bacterium]